MTDTEPETTNPFETEEYAQHVRDCIAKREAWKAELTDSLAKAKAELANAKRVINELTSDPYLDYADESGWLNGDDLEIFSAMWENAAGSVAALAAINRPHPGTLLWPQIELWHSGERTEFGVEFTTAQDVVNSASADRVQQHYLGGFDTAYLAERKGADLLANGHILTGTVKARQHSVTGWADPAEFKNDDE